MNNETLITTPISIKTEMKVLAGGGYSVPKGFHYIIECQVMDAIPTMTPGKSYTPKELCGNSLWDQFRHHERHAAELCIASIAFSYTQPILFASSGSKSGFKYRLA